MDRKSELMSKVTEYTDMGIITHLCEPPEPGTRGSGKRPIWKGWQARKEPYDLRYMKQEITRNGNCNLGFLCGKESDLTIFDVDWYRSGILEATLFHDLDRSEWVTQSHTNGYGKGHFIFRYEPTLKPDLCQDLGFDILTRNMVGGGNNCVCDPSLHVDGNRYMISGNIADRPEMPVELVERINKVISVYEGFLVCLNKCKPLFKAFWSDVFTNKRSYNYHVVDLFRGEAGRKRHIAMFADLKANGATDTQLLLACMLIFGDEFKTDLSMRQINGIRDDMPWSLEQILKDPVLSSYYKESEFDFVTADVDKLESMLKPRARELYETILAECDYEMFEPIRKAFLMGAFSNQTGIDAIKNKMNVQKVEIKETINQTSDNDYGVCRVVTADEAFKMLDEET